MPEEATKKLRVPRPPAGRKAKVVSAGPPEEGIESKPVITLADHERVLKHQQNTASSADRQRHTELGHVYGRSPSRRRGLSMQRLFRPSKKSYQVEPGDEASEDDYNELSTYRQQPVIADAALREERRARSVRARAVRLFRTAVRMHRSDRAAAAVQQHVTGFERLASVVVELRRATEALKQEEVFSNLNETQLSMIASAGHRRLCKRYETLYSEGSPSTCFFLVTEGTLHESVHGEDTPREICVTKGAGARYVLFGTEALHGKPRTSTVSAAADTNITKFTSADLLVSKAGALQVAQNIFHAFVEGEMAHMALFKGIEHAVLSKVVPLFTLEEHPEGTEIFGPGEPATSVYIIMHGVIVISRRKQTLTTLSAEQGQALGHAGDVEIEGMPVFGEMAILDRKPRMASAKAATDCKLLSLSYEHFDECMALIPDLKGRLRRQNVVRIVENIENREVRKANTP